MDYAIMALYRVALLGMSSSGSIARIIECNRHKNGFGISVDVGNNRSGYALCGLYFNGTPEFWGSSVIHIENRLRE